MYKLTIANDRPSTLPEAKYAVMFCWTSCRASFTAGCPKTSPLDNRDAGTSGTQSDSRAEVGPTDKPRRTFAVKVL